MHLEALILDGDDGVDEVGREVFELYEFALLPIDSIISADLFGFDQDRAHGATRGQFENFFDDSAAKAKNDIARGLRSRRMFEGPKVSADSMFLPGVLPLLNNSAAAGFSVSESHKSAPQICEFDIQAWVDDGWRRVDARRNAKSLAIEARPHNSIESNHDDTARKARDEAGGHPKPDQSPKPTARALGPVTPRLRTTLRGHAALARSRFSLSRVSQQSPSGNPSGGRNRD